VAALIHASILIVASVLAVACGPQDPDGRQARFDACLLRAGEGVRFDRAATTVGETYRPLEAVGEYEDAECNRRDERLAGRHRLRLFAHAGRDAPFLVHGMQRYYRRHGLEFVASAQAAAVEVPYLLDNDRAGLERALRCAFPGVDLADPPDADADAIESIAVDYILRPARAFLAAFKTFERDTTDLVAVGRILREPDADAGIPIGLGISPRYLATLRASSRTEAEVWNSVRLPDDFNPTVFVVAPEQTVPPASASVPMDLTLAHEFAHTAGVAHSPSSGNLMVPSLDPATASCRAQLDAQQLAAMARGFAHAPVSKSQSSHAEVRPQRRLGPDLRQSLRQWVRGDRRAFADVARELLDGVNP
jgi:hypothetical protein